MLILNSEFECLIKAVPLIYHLCPRPSPLTCMKGQVPWEPQVLRGVQATSPWLGGCPCSNRHFRLRFLTCFSLVSTAVSRPTCWRARGCYHLDPLGRDKAGEGPDPGCTGHRATEVWLCPAQGPDLGVHPAARGCKVAVALAVAGDPLASRPSRTQHHGELDTRFSPVMPVAHVPGRLRFVGREVRPGSAVTPSRVVLTLRPHFYLLPGFRPLQS